MKDILCTTDLSPVSDNALRHALALAERLGSKVTLLHVLGRKERTPERQVEVEEAMDRQASTTHGAERIARLVLEGEFIERIAQESAKDHAFMVVGTHGPHGLRQNLFGADILKLVRRSAVPTLVVQENSTVPGALDRIVLPVAGHASITKLLDGVCLLAHAYSAEVHVFQLMRPNERPSDELLANKLLMLQRLKAENIRHVEANEPFVEFSVGFAGPTITYASRIGAGAIAIMAHASDEYRYIADAEKERLLTNDAFVPVLCA
ncbi:MAG TPA: universal stress protein [Flavobacteriales bacterium]|nr:universal stress protein [Flavobacteriales bacterium]